MLHVRDDGRRTNVAEAGGLEQVREVAFSRPGEVGLVDRLGIQGSRDLPEQSERAGAPGVIPDGGGDDTPGLRDPAHLAETADGVGHEVDDELGQRRVERAVGEGEGLRRRLPHVDARVSLLHRRHERRRGIDGGDVIGTEPPDQLGRQRSSPAADIDGSLAHRDPRELRHLRREEGRVPPHELVVRVRGDFEHRWRTVAARGAAPLRVAGDPGAAPIGCSA